MTIVTGKEFIREVENLEEAMMVVSLKKELCWIWRIESTRLGTLRKVEVPREEIREATGDAEVLLNIRNRFEKDQQEGQLCWECEGHRIEVKVMEDGKPVEFENR